MIDSRFALDLSSFIDMRVLGCYANSLFDLVAAYLLVVFLMPGTSFVYAKEDSLFR